MGSASERSPILLSHNSIGRHERVALRAREGIRGHPRSSRDGLAVRSALLAQWYISGAK